MRFWVPVVYGPGLHAVQMLSRNLEPTVCEKPLPFDYPQQEPPSCIGGHGTVA